MTVEEYCREYGTEDGYGVALIHRESGRIITPYCGIWSSADKNVPDDKIEQMGVDEQTAVTVDGRYSLAVHSGYYEYKYFEQENGKA